MKNRHFGSYDKFKSVNVHLFTQVVCVGVNCRFSSPLSQKQKIIWALILQGFSVSSIADKLCTTRQNINQTKLATEAKLRSTLLEVAHVNDLQVTRVHPKEGLLVGFHPALRRKAIVTYNSKHGVKVWYWHDNPEEVTDKKFLDETKEYLLDIAAERDIKITNVENLHPALLAHEIFSQLAPELKT
jgi:hypothetical protein